MRFKIFILSLIPFASAIAEENQFHTMSVVVRNSFFNHLLHYLSNSLTSFPVSTCYKDLYFKGHVTLKAKEARIYPVNAQSLFFNAQMEMAQMTGELSEGCTAPKNPIQVSADIKNSQLLFEIKTDDFSLKPSPQMIAELAKQWTIKIGSQNNNSKLFSEALRIQLVSLLFDYGSQQFSLWIKQRLRGLFYSESMTDLVANSRLARENTVVADGAIVLENQWANLKDRQILFSFLPFRNQPVTASSEGLRLYFHSAFLGPQMIENLTELDSTKVHSSILSEKTSEALRNWLPLSTNETENFSIPNSDSDLSLVVKSELINDALQMLYKENLFNFRGKIDIGSQTKGFLTKEKLPVATILQLNPQSAPQFKFEANSLALEVSDFGLQIGSWIEDRVIPSETMAAHVNMSSSLKVDPHQQTVNLQINPESFSIGLTSDRQILERKDLEVVEDLINQSWKQFFEQSPDLVLFPSVIETADWPLRISNIRVNNGLVLMDLSIVWEEL